MTTSPGTSDWLDLERDLPTTAEDVEVLAALQRQSEPVDERVFRAESIAQRDPSRTIDLEQHPYH